MVDDINPCPTLSTVMGHIGWKFENAYRDGRPFDELLEDSECVRVAKRTIGDLKLGNQRCRKCLHRNVCRGGCRVVALANAYVTKPSDEITYYETNPFSCRLFESDVIGRIHRAIREARHVA